jgi:hypothetical protein
MAAMKRKGNESARASIRAKAIVGAAALGILLAAPHEARASLLSPEAEDTLATIIAVLVIFLVPVVLIVLFWMVHVLTEKIAH